MRYDFEIELSKVLNSECAISDKVRASIDNAYESIRKKNKRKKYFKNTIAAAMCLLMVCAILSNDVIASVIKSFFKFNDKGIETAINNGYINRIESETTNNDISIKLQSYFADSNKIGISFKIKIEDLSLLKGDIEKIYLSYSIIDKNGNYIGQSGYTEEENLNIKKSIISSVEDKFELLDLEKGEVQYDIILESCDSSIPKIEEAVIKVDKVNILYKNNKTSIKGNWTLKLIQNNLEYVKEYNYSALNSIPNIDIVSIKAEPTSLNIIFNVNQVYENKEFPIDNLILIDENGNEYKTNICSMNTNDGKTTISTNFKISSYEEHKLFKLIIPNYGEIKLQKK
ncbi:MULTISPECIES: DUF4179 domain-containing protein [Caloramator]|uniref:DUF4179 domain-containing protein n=1 Tax=Caloramator proteoclasticus DSM 10124 TaxID=1121262 RepID=A0A1M4UY07_9CLOT|nr:MULTISPECIES: DUF4179 domain-containing protein [Caloramator]SHE61552.1 protein of unknown function [Caloramator proteoclasticus DSM 10124]